MSKAPPIECIDPIVEEIHETRRALLKEHGGIAGLVAYLRQQEQKRQRPTDNSPDQRRLTLRPKPDEAK